MSRVAAVIRWGGASGWMSAAAWLGMASGMASAGAAGHWAFEPVVRVSPPEVPGMADPVDRFVAAALKERGGALSSPADRRTWLRRVTIDLTGLPATPEAVAAFEADDRPDARERVVDGLLRDPAYGERWGRWWLDVARYADTNGQDENKVMSNAWRYRDWVVHAMNTDMPFDRFVQDQVAGDILAAQAPDEAEAMRRRVATGFLVLGPKLLAEQDKPKLVLDIVDEQLDTVGRAFMGLTMGCARCHDHKHDPVPQRDYYAMAGIFRSTRTMENLAFVSKFNECPVGTREQVAAVERHASEVVAAEARVKLAVSDADAALARDWRAALPAVLGNAVRVEARLAPLVSKVEALRSGPDGGPLRALEGNAAAAEEALQRWEACLGGGGPVPGWRGGGGEFHGTHRIERPLPDQTGSRAWTVSAWVRADAIAKKGETRRWLVSRGANEWEDGHLALLIDGDRAGAYVNIGGGRERVVSVFGKEGGIKAGAWHHLAVALGHERVSAWLDGKEVGSAPLGGKAYRGSGPVVLGQRPDRHVGFEGRLDAVRVFDRELGGDELRRLARGEAVEGTVISEDFEPVTEDERGRLEVRAVAERFLGKGGLLELPQGDARRAAYGGNERERLRAAEDERAALKRRDPGPVPMALAVADDVVTNLPVLARGNHLAPGKEAMPRGFLGCIPGLPVEAPGPGGSGRLELARWLTHPAHPLTARVVVNRVWQAHFGEGLVRTPENFGTRGERPTHPELLDWLASELARTGWSLKALHRRIVLSATYGQASVVEASGDGGRDPDVRWLGRYPRQRLESEMLRDALLAASGRLDRAMGGTLVAWKNDEYVPGDTEPFGSVRRALYLPVVRDRGTDLETAFDGANPSVCVARRGTTVVAQQALWLLNSGLVRESAEALARLAMAQGGTDRCGWLYRRLMGRAPSDAERARAWAFLGDDRLKALPEASRWALMGQALMVSNEFTHRE